MVALAGCGLLAWLGMRGGRVPLLSMADLGFHELGHLVCYVLDAFLPWPELVTAAAGSGFQVGVPLGLAAYFLLAPRDRLGGALCLAWAGTAAADVARYVADAPYQAMPLIGGQHDWASILGPEQLDRLDDAAGWARAVDGAGWLLVAAGVVVALLPLARWLLAGDPPTGPSGSAGASGSSGPADEAAARFPV